MKRFVAGMLAACALALGCGGEGSSEGMVWNLVLYVPRDEATPEQVQRLEDAIRGLPPKIPGMERFEWGRVENNDSSNTTHCLLVTVRESGDTSGVYEALRDEAAEGYIVTPSEFGVHDATPHAPTATRGHLRRVVWLPLIRNGATPEEVRKVEDAMSALPSKIPAIERLQWGTQTFFDPPEKLPATPPTSPRHSLLLTFKDADARDECLAHPAYKEFEELVAPLVGEPASFEYIALGERD